MIFIWGAAILGAIFLTVFAIGAKTNRPEQSQCNSPCVVNFPKGTQEDDFKIDWQDGKLIVSRLGKGHS